MIKTISLFGCSFQSSPFLQRKIPIISWLEDVFRSFVIPSLNHMSKKYCKARTFSPHHINFTSDDVWLESKALIIYLKPGSTLEHDLPTGINKFSGTGEHQNWIICQNYGSDFLFLMPTRTSNIVERLQLMALKLPMLCWLWASTEPKAIRSFAGGAVLAPRLGGYSVPKKDANAKALERGVLLFSVKILTSLCITNDFELIFMLQF